MNEKTKPNILLITADQWRYDCLSCAGHPVVHTPYLDQLALNGTRWNCAYSAAPTCIPARASLYTGLRPRSHGFVGFDHSQPWPYKTTIASVFSEAGYQTQAIGKMHVFPERSKMGFESVTLHSSGGIVKGAQQRGQAADSVDDYGPWLREQLGRNATQDEHGVDTNSTIGRPWDKPEHTHYTNFVSSETVNFLHDRDQARPFFLYMSFNAPHPPLDPPDWAFEMYRNRQMPEPPVGDWVERVYGPLFQPYHHAPNHAVLDEHVLQLARAGYYGHMTHIDHQINRVLHELSKVNQLENTIVLFTSDHGDMMGDHNCFRKGVPYEGSTHVPLIMMGPGIAKGEQREQLVELSDIMPTLLEAAGIDVPSCVDGKSFLRDGRIHQDIHGEHVLWSAGSFQWMTDGREKYIWMSKDGTEQLFNLEEDPQEMRDLAADSSRQERVAFWRRRLTETMCDFEEGFVEDGKLIPGRPVKILLNCLTKSKSAT